MICMSTRNSIITLFASCIIVVKKFSLIRLLLILAPSLSAEHAVVPWISIVSGMHSGPEIIMISFCLSAELAVSDEWARPMRSLPAKGATQLYNYAASSVSEIHSRYFYQYLCSDIMSPALNDHETVVVFAHSWEMLGGAEIWALSFLISSKRRSITFTYLLIVIYHP